MPNWRVRTHRLEKIIEERDKLIAQMRNNLSTAHIAADHDIYVLEQKVVLLEATLKDTTKSFECYSYTNPTQKKLPEDWDEYDSMMGPIWIRAKALLEE